MSAAPPGRPDDRPDDRPGPSEGGPKPGATPGGGPGGAPGTGGGPGGSRRTLVPDLLWEDGRFRAGRALSVGEDGEIIGILDAGTDGRHGPPATRPGDRGPVERLRGRALLPGFVNAHSHAFQRLIRGRTQWAPPDAAEPDFWSWRDAMYAAAAALSPEDLYVVSRFCFAEMLRAGYTAVGEFHYLHRDPEGRPYDDPNELALRVVAAARDAGIRIRLLRAAYAAGGPDEPLGPGQVRFATPDLDAFLAETEALESAVRDRPGVDIGLAPHSVRAVPREWHGPLARWAAERGVPRHVHLNEQTGEVEATLAAWGLRPVEVLAEEGALDDRLVGIHLTHPSPREVVLLADADAAACLCPSTERDLGDGVPPAAELLEAGISVSLGSDSHTMLDPWEEMRLVEYHERLRALRRVVLAPEGTERREVAPRLLDFATRGGARALRLSTGRLRRGAAADLVAVDLAHPALAGSGTEHLAAALVFCAPPDVVTDVWVAGERRVEARRHPDLEETGTARAFRRLAESLPSREPGSGAREAGR